MALHIGCTVDELKERMKEPEFEMWKIWMRSPGNHRIINFDLQ